jgi:hypothetical protein
MEHNFWCWVDWRLSQPDMAGMTEQQFLDTVKRPGWTGMKARPAQANKVVPLGGQDRMMAAANDLDAS